MAFNRQYIAGAYKVIWDADVNQYNLGYTEAGFELNIELADFVPIQEDRHGQTILDGLFQGIQSCTVRIESLYWNQDVWASAFPYIVREGGEDNFNAGKTLFTAGELLHRGSHTKKLVLEAVTGFARYIDVKKGAEEGFGEKWTFNAAISVESATLLFAAREIRRVPITFQIFPTVEDSGENADKSEAVWWDRTFITEVE